MSYVKKMVYTAIMIAFGVVLPILLHSVPGAPFILLPMHLPVLMCGIICGFPYGLACGILTPLVSSLQGMPPAAMLPSMICELAVYGLIAGLLINFVRLKNIYVRIYIALVGSMLCGRVIYGLVNAFIFQAGGGYTLQAWVTAMFVTALPGIAVQLILIPAIVITLQKAKLIEI